MTPHWEAQSMVKLVRVSIRTRSNWGTDSFFFSFKETTVIPSLFLSEEV